jgi:hypothetical protein
MDMSESTQGRLEDEAELLRERGMQMMRRWTEQLETLIRERPGTTLLAALGLGYLIGRIVRR